MRIVVLRPEPGNAATCTRIAAAGGTAVPLPLFAVQPVAWTPPPAAAFDHLLLTSANAVRHAGPALSQYRALPVIAVGAQTARAAEAAGLRVAYTGETDAAEALDRLAGLGATRALHLTGADQTVVEGGAIARVVAVYASVAIRVEPAALTALVDAMALLHSPRAAQRLGALVDAANLDRARIAIASMSAAIDAAAGGGWAARVIAPRIDDAELVAAALRWTGEARRSIRRA